eukprot:TRINITY_DN22872_c0_g1_i1.p1 TRINITY_DN22872_c0_g1~~TRINITY_DN22872_c0_g1_i1.p1  ORF type:complete len:640 (+),score=75.56 TRINITY_DN22872_c0_g1_i1:47-1921(+)
MLHQLLTIMATTIGVAAGVTCQCGIFQYTAPNGDGSDRGYCPLVTDEGAKTNPNSTQPHNEYHPLPMMERPSNTWLNLNGWWDFQPAGGEGSKVPTPPTNFTKKIVVPYPPESCLSGFWITGMGMDDIPRGLNSWNFRLWYRKIFNAPSEFTQGKTVLLHFGAVDWQATVFVNGVQLPTHTGGYDAFYFDITAHLKATDNEILVFSYDPSDWGTQPFGKQRVSAVRTPSGDTYSPSSGIWQTVWLESVPDSRITSYRTNVDLLSVEYLVNTTDGGDVTVTLYDGTTQVAEATGPAGTFLKIAVPNPKLWSPASPFLYNVTLTHNTDSVKTYVGLRTIVLGKDINNVSRPLLNGKPIYLHGWLDQSFWPDGLYTPPTEASIQFDLQAVKDYGFNLVRLHQKVNMERWYYYADTLGLIVFQDAVQKYGSPHGNASDFELYKADFTAMVEGKRNHPCIVQWTIFNEEDMKDIFSDLPEMVTYARSLDSSRLLDGDSGGPANNEHLADVNDVHNYPNPKPNSALPTQYAMYGEWGGFGLFVEGHEWWPNLCYSYSVFNTSAQFLTAYAEQISALAGFQKQTSASVFTQLSDVERECDGFYTYDRISKFAPAEMQQIKAENEKLIAALV